MSECEQRSGQSSSRRSSRLMKYRSKRRKHIRANTKVKDPTLVYFKLVRKVDALLDLIQQSKHIVVYSSYGVHQSGWVHFHYMPASGLWGQIKRTRKYAMRTLFDLSGIVPTYTHMAITELCKVGLVKHVMDLDDGGLYLRSGLSQAQLSEILGNQYIQVCDNCQQQYFREADEVERVYNFGRRCRTCTEPNNQLVPTVSGQFFEEERTEMPMNWPGAKAAAKQADLVIMIGCDIESFTNFPFYLLEKKFVIINHEATDLDYKQQAQLTIRGKYDLIMKELMQRLDIAVPAYDWRLDPLVAMAASFHDKEKDLNGNIILDLSATISSDQQAPSTPTASPALGPTDRASNDDSNQDKPANSPSLFVSELTDDPERKHLKMRIRLNTDNVAISSGNIGRRKTESPCNPTGSGSTNVYTNLLDTEAFKFSCKKEDCRICPLCTLHLETRGKMFGQM